MVKAASRIEKIPPYLFARIDKKKAEARVKGIDLIDLGVGDPDLPTPAHIVKKMQEATADPRNHRYPSYEGMYEFRKAVADWYGKRFGVSLDPDKEVVTLIGSKEGIAHMPWAYLQPLVEENEFLPLLHSIPVDVLSKARIMFINYPNNPTGAHAGDDFYERLIRTAAANDILICHDAAYSEVTYDGYKARSVLEFDKEKKYSIEFHSLSKTYCMTGWRIGFAVGNAEAVQNLGKLKTNIDSGVFQAVQIAGIEALNGSQDSVERMKTIFAERRDAVVDGLSSLGIKVKRPLATFYIWARVPAGYSSADFAEKLITEKGVVVTPGSGFGDEGEGYFRISITSDIKRIKEAIERLRSLTF